MAGTTELSSSDGNYNFRMMKTNRAIVLRASDGRELRGALDRLTASEIDLSEIQIQMVEMTNVKQGPIKNDLSKGAKGKPDVGD